MADLSDWEPVAAAKPAAPSSDWVPVAANASAAPTEPAAAPAEDKPKPNIMSVLDRIPGGSIITGPTEALAKMASGAVAAPVSQIMGLAAMGHDVATGKPEDATGFQEAIRRAMTYEPRTGAGKAVAEYNPLSLIGKGVNWMGTKAENLVAPAGSSTPRQMLGAGIHEAINQAPQFLGPAAEKVAGATGESLKGYAKDWMQSAMKPTLEALRTGKAQKAIDTMLEQGINVSPGGVSKIENRVDALNNQIKQQIANSPATIDKEAVAARIQPLLDKFRKQVNATDDLAAIQKAHDDFINHPLLNGPDMPVQLAQELKQGTYRSLGNKAYGELKGASIEAQKALAKGLKEEIAKAVPQVNKLNADESKLLDALSVSERRVMMEANKNPVGLGWLTTDPVKFAGWMADRSGLFKSLVARMLNKSGDVANASLPAAKPSVIAVAQEAKAAHDDEKRDAAEKERKYQAWKRKQEQQ